MRDVHIMVEVELMRSDGNYGRDRAVCQYSAMLEEDEDMRVAREELLGLARLAVEEQLGQSASLEVRRTMLRKPRLCNHCGEPLADEIRWELHPACDQLLKDQRAQQRAEQNARWTAEREALAGVGARPTGQNGEDIEAEQDYGDPDDDEALPL